MPTIKNSANATIGKSSVGNDRGFTGYKLDAESNLYAARARMYSAKLGRFISRDPFRLCFLIHRQGFEITADVMFPTAGDSYWSKFNTYIGAFAPNMLDPTGMIDCGDLKTEEIKKKIKESLDKQKKRQREQGGYIVKDPKGNLDLTQGDDSKNTETSHQDPPYWTGDDGVPYADEDLTKEIVGTWHTHPPLDPDPSPIDRNPINNPTKVPGFVFSPLPDGSWTCSKF